MSPVKQSPQPRNRSQEPKPGSSGRAVDRDISSQSNHRRIVLVWSRETTPPGRTSAAMTRLTVAASARVAGYAGGDALHIVVAILSWILWEFLHACAAYAQAMYPPVEAFDRELEFAEPGTAKPGAPARPGSDTTIAAGKPRLTIAASNDPSAATSRSGPR